MNHNLKSALIGGGSIGLIVTAILIVVYVIGGLVFGVAETTLFGPAFWVLLGLNMIASFLGIAAWIFALIDASSNVALHDKSRMFWIVMIALFGIWIVPFYWFKYVRR